MNHQLYAQLPKELDCDWLYKELIPMLNEAYGERSVGYRKEGVRQAALRIKDLVSISAHRLRWLY